MTDDLLGTVSNPVPATNENPLLTRPNSPVGGGFFHVCATYAQHRCGLRGHLASARLRHLRRIRPADIGAMMADGAMGVPREPWSTTAYPPANRQRAAAVQAAVVELLLMSCAVPWAMDGGRVVSAVAPKVGWRRSRAGAGCVALCLWRSGSGPRSGPGADDAVRGRVVGLGECWRSQVISAMASSCLLYTSDAADE